MRARRGAALISRFTPEIDGIVQCIGLLLRAIGLSRPYRFSGACGPPWLAPGRERWHHCPLLDVNRFPKTRYQGSKRKLLGALADALLPYGKGTAIDLYSGSGSVTLLLRHLGFQVISNDYLKFANNTARVFLEATPDRLRAVNWPARLEFLLRNAPISGKPLVREGFRGVFFTDGENLAIDRFCQNVRNEAPFPRAVLTYAVGQALLMKRPYNLFHRANLYMRLSRVKRSFGNATTWAKPIEVHAQKAIEELLEGPFHSSSKGHEIINANVAHLESLPRRRADLVYVDPPYIAATGKAIDYADFYHFLEGLIDYSLFAGGESEWAHRPIFRAATRWVSRDLAVKELEDIANAWPEATIVMSYRDDGIPSATELRQCLSVQNRKVSLQHLGTYKYALARSVTSREILLTAAPAPRGRSDQRGAPRVEARARMLEKGTQSLNIGKYETRSGHRGTS